MNFLTKPFASIEEKLDSISEVSSILTILGYILSGIAYRFELSKEWYLLVAPLLLTTIGLQVSMWKLVMKHKKELTRSPNVYYWKLGERMLANLILLIFALHDLEVLQLILN